MEIQETNKCAVRVFTLLMQKMVSEAFLFPGGSVAKKTVRVCMSELEKKNIDISEERIVDFCVCQVSAICGFGPDYMRKWNITHSFGKKALERFDNSSKFRRGREDKWLKTGGLSRADLMSYIEDKSKHPFYQFIFPEWEEGTKKRVLSTEVGYYICAQSTLMWTPFSPSCQQCLMAGLCKERTQNMYSELFRIRIEEFRRKEGKL